MMRMEVDGSLVFHFSSAWNAVRWEDAHAHRGRTSQRKKVDIAAVGPSALLVEAKDDRIKDPVSKKKRKKAIKSGDFLADVAMKFQHSAEDILAVEAQSDSGAFYAAFVARWTEEQRQCVLWWELPREPPSGNGTQNDRWKAYLSALQNTLKQRLHGLTARVRIANQHFGADLVSGMEVATIAAGIERRRDSLRPR